MLELFSRTPDAIHVRDDSHLTPIPIDATVSSLSAILLAGEYYEFLQSGKRVVQGVPIVGPEHLIPLKAKAWLDLSECKADGADIDANDIKKHKNDVFRLLTIVDPEFRAELSPQIRTDLTTFIEKMTNEDIALKQLGLGRRSLEETLAELQRIYRVG